MKFEELNETQKEKAIEHYRNINVDYDDWNDGVKDDHYLKLHNAGFIDVDSQYSGFCSQGDGASFTAEHVDIETFLRSQKRWTYYRPLHEHIKINEIWVKVVRTSHHYSHEYTTEAQIGSEHYIDLSARQTDLYNELEKEIDDFITKAGQSYYNDLSTEYFDLISNDSVKEAIIANDIDFEEKEYGVCYL